MPETILIVDDTPANLGVLVETLGVAGYQLMVAEDGEEALAQTLQTQPDLILLDVMMPGIDGYETCRRLKARAETRDIPVLFMTALNETTDKVKAFAAGAVDYIAKPIEHEEALARVGTHLAIRRLQRELQEQIALKQKFMKIAGHDLRNPLFLILLATELARRQTGIPPKVIRFLESIEESAAHIRRIIDTFLEIRTPAPGPKETGGVDLGLLGTAVVRQHEHAAEIKNIRLTLESIEGLPLVRCEAALSYQAFSNFISNALKFTPVGGQVTVRTQLLDNIVRVEVQDSGPGVPPNERERLFRKPGRLSPRPTAGEESTGHGLTIVKQLVESQLGRVGATFPNEGGSVFWFELPIANGTT
jgi:two-component system, sensor histidine kinase and response regulator